MPATNYRKPDRSNFTPSFRKTPDNEALDIGWAEGSLSDGRPYRLECWAQDQITNITVFVSIHGLDHLDDEAAVESWLEQEGLLKWLSDERYVVARPFSDASEPVTISRAELDQLVSLAVANAMRERPR